MPRSWSGTSAFCDLPTLDDWLVGHLTGWDTATVARLLERLGHVPIIQFGDLDPNGVRIFQHLRSIRPDVRSFVPESWAEFTDAKGLPGVSPEDLDLGDTPELVRLPSKRAL